MCIYFIALCVRGPAVNDLSTPTVLFPPNPRGLPFRRRARAPVKSILLLWPPSHPASSLHMHGCPIPFTHNSFRIIFGCSLILVQFPLLCSPPSPGPAAQPLDTGENRNTNKRARNDWKKTRYSKDERDTHDDNTTKDGEQENRESATCRCHAHSHFVYLFSCCCSSVCYSVASGVFFLHLCFCLCLRLFSFALCMFRILPFGFCLFTARLPPGCHVIAV